MEWIPEQLDPEDDHTREVYAHAGLVLYMGQVVQQALENVIVAAKVGSPKFRKHKDFERLQEQLAKMTMGQQLRRALEEVDFSDAQIEQLELALDRRNFLVHRYFFERVADTMSTSGKNRMIEELDAIRDLFASTNDEIDEVFFRYLGKHGITEAIIEAEALKLKAEAAVLEQIRIAGQRSAQDLT